MNKVFIVGQWNLKNETHLGRFFSNSEFGSAKQPTWFSGIPNDYVHEPVIETLRWMEAEELDKFSLQLIYE